MYNLLVSFFGGFMVTSALFVICFLIVIGGKIIFIIARDFYKDKNIKLTAEPVSIKTSKPRKKAQPTKQKTKSPEPIRSIEINPDEIDKIYVRKI